MFDQLKTLRLYDLRYTLAAPLLEQTVYPWEALSGIRAFIEATGAALPAEDGANPRMEFRKEEWLDDIVVGTALQSLDAHLTLPACGQHENWFHAFIPSQAAQQGEAIFVGEAQIEDNRGVVDGLDQKLGIACGAGQIAAHVALRKCRNHRVGEFGIVLDDQQPHLACSVAVRGCRWPGSFSNPAHANLP